jgi:hypothetical protein
LDDRVGERFQKKFERLRIGPDEKQCSSKYFTTIPPWRPLHLDHFTASKQGYLKDLLTGSPAAKTTQIRKFKSAVCAQVKPREKAVAQAAWELFPAC